MVEQLGLGDDSATSSARLYWENGGRGAVVAAAQKTAEISVPVAITVFPEEIYRAPETWARRAYRNPDLLQRGRQGRSLRRVGRAGYDWGARTANIVAALWPERCKAIVSVNGYPINNLERNQLPLPPRAEWGWWYQHNLPQEAPQAFSEAVVEVDGY